MHGTELATEWARQRITRLTADGQGAAATKLALARGLVSATTALIAVAPTTGPAVESTVTVPLPLPAGLRPGSLAGAAGDVFDNVEVTGSSDLENRTVAKPDDPTKQPATDATKDVRARDGDRGLDATDDDEAEDEPGQDDDARATRAAGSAPTTAMAGEARYASAESLSVVSVTAGGRRAGRRSTRSRRRRRGRARGCGSAS